MHLFAFFIPQQIILARTRLPTSPKVRTISNSSSKSFGHTWTPYYQTLIWPKLFTQHWAFKGNNISVSTEVVIHANTTKLAGVQIRGQILLQFNQNPIYTWNCWLLVCFFYSFQEETTLTNMISPICWRPQYRWSAILGHWIESKKRWRPQRLFSGYSTSLMMDLLKINVDCRPIQSTTHIWVVKMPVWYSDCVSTFSIAADNEALSWGRRSMYTE